MNCISELDIKSYKLIVTQLIEVKPIHEISNPDFQFSEKLWNSPRIKSIVDRESLIYDIVNRKK